MTCCKGDTITIGIIDSGLDKSIVHSQNSKISFIGHVTRSDKGPIIETTNFYDQIGHGTAIYSIINKKIADLVNINYVIIKIFDNSLITNVEALVLSVNKCIEKKCDIINISAVITNNNSNLEEICNKAYKKNIKIVAAEANFPTKTAFPAQYKTCYGVKAGKCYGTFEYYFEENTHSQFVARGDEQRLTWLNKTELFMAGASFATAHVTAIIAFFLKNNKNITRNKLEDTIKKHSLPNPPKLVSLSPQVAFNLFVDSEEMHYEASRFLNWNNPNQQYSKSLILTNEKNVLGCDFIYSDNLSVIPYNKYDSVIVSRDYLIKDLNAFEKKLIENNKSIYYLNSNYERIIQRKLNSLLINDFNFNLSFLNSFTNLKQYLNNYIVKAPILGVISSSPSVDCWNKAYRIKSLFEAEGYNAVIFDTTSNSTILGAQASCCCSSEKDIITDFSNYKRILSFFIKCLDYQYTPDIIIVIGRIALTKEPISPQYPNNIIQSCAVIFSCLIEAFVSIDDDRIVNDNYIHNLETLSNGKFIGCINNDNIDNIYKKIKEFFS